MAHSYAATGGITFGPRFLAGWEPVVVARFDVSDIVYVRRSARFGRLEAVCVRDRDVREQVSSRDGVWYRILYRDSYNGVWNEADLCSLEEAQALKRAHDCRLGGGCSSPGPTTASFAARGRGGFRAGG